MKLRKGQGKIIGVVVASLGMAVGALAGGGLLQSRQSSFFATDGYVLEVISDEEGQSVAPVNFSNGSSYTGEFPSKYRFKNAQGKKVSVGEKSFIHYTEGSISSFADGMVVNMAEAADGLVDFYRIGPGMVMTCNEDGRYSIDNNGNEIEFGELLWMLDQKTMLVSSPSIKASLASMEEEEWGSYVEIRYLDSGIIQVADPERALQTVSANGRLTLQSGAVIELDSREVLGTEGNGLFSLEELMADMPTGIVLQSMSATSWKPPVYNVQTENGLDGADGENGANGETGKSGEIGEDGESGEPGEAGEAGVAGGAGAPGSAGAAGSAGTPGAPGTPGTPGGTGDRGFSNGGYPTSGDDEKSSAYGIVRITNMEYTGTSVSFDIETSGSSVFRAGSGMIEIRDATTNRNVWSQEKLDFKSSTHIENITCDVLKPDTLYSIIVSSEYIAQVDGMVEELGRKTYVKRDFFTASEGLAFSLENVDYDKVSKKNYIYLRMQKQTFSTAACFKLKVNLGGMQLIWPDVDGQPCGVTNTNYIKNNIITLDLEDLCKVNNILKPGALSNQEFSIEVYSSTLAPASAAGYFAYDAETGEFAREDILKRGGQVVTGRTLKQLPVFDDTQSLTVRYVSNTYFDKVEMAYVPAGYYQLRVMPVADLDSCITSYQFQVIGRDGYGARTVLDTLDSNTGEARWYGIGGIPGGMDCYIVANVRFYDNAKEGVITLPEKGPLNVTSAQSSVDYKPEDLKSTSFKGDLVILGVQLSVEEGQLVLVEIKDDEDYKLERYYPVPYAQNNNYRLPVEVTGLKPDTVYYITVYATIEEEYSVGSTTQISKETRAVGKATVKTNP